MEEAISPYTWRDLTFQTFPKEYFLINTGLHVYEAYESPLLEIKNPKGF